MRRVEAVRACVIVEGSPLESFEGNGGLCISVLIFCL